MPIGEEDIYRRYGDMRNGYQYNKNGKHNSRSKYNWAKNLYSELAASFLFEFVELYQQHQHWGKFISARWFLFVKIYK